MLLFKTVAYKNFQSVGNAGMKIDLCRSMTTVVGGQNGAGKSTLLEAISYALFGKPLKKLTLGGLINTINKKGLLVELDFECNGKEYKIVRGQKPSRFEFYIAGELQDQNAASKDYQSKIEYVLGMDYKLFTQIVVLNKEKYIPFMELDAAARRKVVEDVLDISIFSSMSDLLKDKSRLHSLKINDVKRDRERLGERIEGQKRLLNEARNNIDDRVAELKAEIQAIGMKQTQEVARKLFLEDDRKSLSDAHTLCAALEKKKSGYDSVSAKFKQSMISAETTSKFFNENDVCPTCTAAIAPDIKQAHIDECSSKIADIRANSAKMVEIYEGIVSDISIQRDRINKYNALEAEIRLLERSIKVYGDQINSNMQKINDARQSARVNDIADEHNATVEQFDAITVELQKLIDEEVAINTCKGLLKDDGIKASVVRDYIEFINLRVNEYLASMDFFLNIKLDESFNDSINAVNREGFTYDNLSTGQKTRVNLSIWLALLEVASIKNSVVTNILFLDEILEAMDAEGVASFMKLITEKLPQKNTFVVTQRFAEFKDLFRSELQFKLCDGFTEII